MAVASVAAKKQLVPVSTTKNVICLWAGVAQFCDWDSALEGDCC